MPAFSALKLANTDIANVHKMKVCNAIDLTLSSKHKANKLYSSLFCCVGEELHCVSTIIIDVNILLQCLSSADGL